MKKTSACVSWGLLFVAATILTHISKPLPTSPIPGRKPSEVAQRQLVATYAQLPLAFEANQGQTDPSVSFLARGSGYTLFLTANEAVLTLRRSRARQQADIVSRVPQGSVTEEEQIPRYARGDKSRAGRQGKNVADQVAVLRMKLVGANSAPEVASLDELPGKSNYFLGNDPAQWRANVPTYAKVRYGDVYPGIDLVYYGNQGQLEYDFVVAPGADPKVIQFAVEGADSLDLDAQGDLVLHASDQQVRFRKPLIYQETDGVRQEIAGRYALQESAQVSFEIAAYDARKPVVIDPAFVYSTYLGGSGEDIGYAIAVDSSGNAYIAGETDSANFPKATPLQAAWGGRQDAFVAKLNPSGSAFLYSTYLGGTGSDFGLGIAVDSSGTAYLTGGTDSPNFPTVGPIQPTFRDGGVDAFVARLNANGSALVYSTYLGGGGGDIGYGIAVDSSGNAYVTGVTGSLDFPKASPFQSSRNGNFFDAFVTKLNPTGSTLVYSTYLGGGANEEGPNRIAVDSAGNAYVTGHTHSGNFPTLNPFQGTYGGGTCGTATEPFPCPDAFVTKFNSAGTALVYSTYLGGAGDDQGWGIAVDSSGNAYLTGVTDSTNFPTANPFQGTKGAGIDAFLTKINSGGSTLVYSTYLGAGGSDRGFGIAVDSSGSAYVTGLTGSSAFPTLNPLQTRGGIFDAFVTKFSPTGSSLVYSSYLGGSGFETIDGGIAVDAAGNAYVTGSTDSSNFPTANPLQGAYPGGTCGTAPNTFPCDDAFVVKITEGNPVPTLTLVSPSGTTAGAAGFTLSVNGSNFMASSVVRWNGANRPTRFVSISLLEASIPASDIATAGTAQVTVFSPSPGGGTSNPITFSIVSGPGPVITAAGLVNGASFTAPPPAAAAIASLFGSNLASANAAAGSLPLPTSLGGVTVRVNNVAAPLFFVSPGQINFQMPWELLGQTQASLTVTVGTLTSTPVTVNPSAFAPGIFSTNSQGTGQGAILISSSGEVAAPVGSIPGRATRPVNRGEFLTIYCTGLGDVTNRPASGAAAGSDPLSSTTATATVTLGGVSANVNFSGLSPGFVGLYQVNAEVPANAPTGDAVAVVLTIGGATSNTVTIAVQ